MSNNPIWKPTLERAERTNMSRFLRFARQHTSHQDIDDYSSLYEFSINRPEQFWPLVWDFCGIRASGDFEPVLADGNKMPGAKFYPNVKLNFAKNLLRYQDDKTAIVFRSEKGDKREYTYAQLHVEVARFAEGLKQAGVAKGDRVAGFMPNMPETVIAMLATTSLGAVWSSCSPDFGINGVVDRFGQIEPKVLITADAYAYNGKSFDCLDKISGVMEKITSIEKLVVVPYTHESPDLSRFDRAVLWADFAAQGKPVLHFELTEFNHPLYIMYSSGTTGVPKCIVHGAGGTLLQHLKELVLHTNVQREDKVFYYTTCGWMMWNWVVSTLATGATLVLYDGSPMYPNADSMWDMADEVGISVFGTSAKWLASQEKAGIKPRETHKLEKLQTILSTGSPLKPESFDYVYRDIKEQVLLASISGGTDIISCFALGNPVLPVYRGQLQCRGLGMAVEALDDSGKPVRGQAGELSCLKPFPSMPISFWNDPDGERYRKAYFDKQPGVWSHGDFVQITEEDGVIIYGRSDATLNPGGIRIGTAEIYRQVEQVPAVLESIAVGQRQKGDERVVLFVRLREDKTLTDALCNLIKKQIRANTTPRHVPAVIKQVADIPRTISGKISEVAVRKAIHGESIKNTDALANPESLDEYRALKDEL